MGSAKRRRNRGHKSFVMLPRKMIRSKDWKDLTPAAREIYCQLKGKYNGSNNGEIRLYHSELKDIKGLKSPSTRCRAFQELENNGWVVRTKLGGLFRYFNEYKLSGKFDDSL